MAAKELGSILLKGKVVIQWENGASTQVGEVSTFVNMVLADDEPVTITATKES